MPKLIPDELETVFYRFRGTGRFTVGEVREFVARRRLIEMARGMNLLEWIGLAVDRSREKGLVKCGDGLDGRWLAAYIDDNIDLWVEMWRNAQSKSVHLSSAAAEKFVEEGLAEMAARDVYEDDGAKYSLVRLKV